LAAHIIAYVLAAALGFVMNSLLPSVGLQAASAYSLYAQLLLAFGIGYLIVNAVSNAAYWSLRARYEQGGGGRAEERVEAGRGRFWP
jgi:hypothetical protein